MKFYKAFSFLTLLACFSLTSCYHEFANGGGGGGGGGNNNGNAFVNVLATSTPSTAFYFPSLTFEIGSISIVDRAGAEITLAGGAGTPLLSFAQMQTDSIYLGHRTLPATSFTTLKVVLTTAVFSYVYNGTNATLFSAPNACAPATVCLIPSTVPGYGTVSLSVPITYSTTANSNTGIRINFDLSKAVTTAAGLTFDFTQPGAITVISDPPAASSQTAGVDTVDNFTGVVTATTATSVTVGSFTSEQRTFAFATGAEFDDPFNICPTHPVTANNCLAVGQNVSIDGFIAADSSGTRTATEVEFLDAAPAVNELEGIIISPVTNNQFKMVLTNGMGSNINIVTDTQTVSLSNATNFLIDPKGLGQFGVATSMQGFQSQADLVLGQTVMVQGGTANNSNGTLTNPTRVLLRYSSISGSVQGPSGTIFTLNGLSPFFTNLATNSVSVQTYTPGTAYDNISGFPGLSNVTNVSVRGLYLNPNSGITQPLLAAKIRSH